MGMEDCPQSEEDKEAMRKVPYASLIGALNYLAVSTRPDIANAVSRCSRYLANPGQTHWTAAKRILRYLKGTPDVGITYTRGMKGGLVGYADADHGGCLDTRRSTTGYIIYYGGGPILWKSKRQTVTSLSTMESEYVAASAATRELVGLRNLLHELGHPEDSPTTLYEDNQSCIAHVKNPLRHARVKHLDIKLHFLRDAAESGSIVMTYIPTDKQRADFLTKPLSEGAFANLIPSSLGGFGM